MRCQLRILICVLGCYAWCWADPLSCDLSAYRVQPGLRAQGAADSLQLSWDGANGQELRASFGIENGTPVVRELAVRKKGGQWQILGKSLTPEFDTVSGKRRIGTDQLAPLRQLGITDPKILAAKKWNAFWDAPLMVGVVGGRNEELPRKPEEIHRGVASFHATTCAVKTDGGRLEVSFPGVSMGIFSGRLQFTVYKGTNLLREEVIAKTDEPDVAYKYNGGLKGFRIADVKRVVWRDVARGWQKYEFGGSPNQGPVGLIARNRLAIIETAAGSLAYFPSPHKFFWSREHERNLGYVYYRKDNEESFGVGVRQPEHDESYRPYGFTDAVWERRVGQSRNFRFNFALYNAPPGTWQRMAVYFYLSPDAPPATQQAVMAFTHDDQFKPLPGYQVAASHFHTHMNEEITDEGSLDWVPAWIPTFRALGINILMMSDFHSDSHPGDPGPLRLAEQKVYFDASRRHSDRGFLILPAEEPNRYLRAHYTTTFSRPVYWTMQRRQGQPFVEEMPGYGKVYHVGSLADEMELLRLENGYVWLAHPRTKSSDGYPDAIKDSIQLNSDRYLGASFEALPSDNSQARLCEERCFGTMDDMNNWGSGLKYLVSEGDTYTKYPDDETYPALSVNYIKLDRTPRFDEDWSPILKSMRAGDYFVTTGEVLIKRLALEGSGPKRTMVADLEWTYPMEFVEVVWGDGQKIDRQVIPATDLPPFGTHTFRIPVDVTGKKWVRFAAWDSSGSGAFAQPVHVTP